MVPQCNFIIHHPVYRTSVGGHRSQAFGVFAGFSSSGKYEPVDSSAGSTGSARPPVRTQRCGRRADTPALAPTHRPPGGFVRPSGQGSAARFFSRCCCRRRAQNNWRTCVRYQCRWMPRQERISKWSIPSLVRKATSSGIPTSRRRTGSSAQSSGIDCLPPWTIVGSRNRGSV
jgi:hypothetical protein